MPSFPMDFHRRLVASLTVAVSILALQAGAASAKPIPALKMIPHRAVAAAPAPVLPETVLKRLPAGRDELTMRGETARRAFTVTLGPEEAARTSVFQIALLNAVSLLPDRSTISIVVNGTALAPVQPNSADKSTLLPLKIPSGLLVSGPNSVEIIAALSHRVDCSVKATYELWATLDPAQTGFLVPRDAAFAVRSIGDLALEPLAADGTTRIHLRMGEGASSAEIGQAGRVIDALARRNALARPIVDVGSQRGTGAGFDVVVADGGRMAEASQGLAIDGSGDGVTVGRDRLTNRLVVVVSDADAAVSAASVGLGQGAPGAAREGFRKTFAELGLPTEAFAGRHYASTIDVNLPQDFLASDDRARVLLDGSHAESLTAGSELTFRVNGSFISSMPLAAGEAERFRHAIVELPLRFFHPGHNDLSIEAVTSATFDGSCDTMAMPREPRLTIAATSELEFPRFVHFATMPQIPVALTYDAAAEDGAIHVYLPDAGRRSVGAGLTVLANIAVTQRKIGSPQIHIGGPGPGDTPGIVIGAAGDLPPGLAAALGRLTAPVSDQAALSDTPERAALADDTAASAGFPRITSRSEEDGTATGLGALAARSLSGVRTLLQNHGFFFAIGERTDPLPQRRGALTIAAVAPLVSRSAIAGIALPQVTRTGVHWLVVAAADREIVAGALEKLVASGRWDALSGEAASFDPAKASLRILQPRTVSYVLPDSFFVSDLRPIIASAMTDNIMVSVIMLLLLMAILGVSTHAVIRHIGVK